MQILRQEVVDVAAEMYRRDLISGPAGNISVRLPDGNLLVTPSGGRKDQLDPGELLVIDRQGNCLNGDASCRPTSELPMHLEVYGQRPDVAAVIHAHPISCVALSLAGVSLVDPYIPEALVFLGPVPTAPYATPASEENREAIAGLIQDHDAIILAHHGSLTVGSDLDQAFMRLEILEHTAKTVVLACQIGTPRRLDPDSVEKLLAQREGFGFRREEESPLSMRIAAEVERLALDLDRGKW